MSKPYASYVIRSLLASYDPSVICLVLATLDMLTLLTLAQWLASWTLTGETQVRFLVMSLSVLT
jgi:hypothetical protein